MNTGSVEIWRVTALAFGLLVMPGVYFWTVWRLWRTEVPAAPYFEMFVGCGTVGGWCLYTAFAGSAVLLMLALGGFQVFVATPVAVFALWRSAYRPAPTVFHRAARWLLTIAILPPLFVIFIIVAGPR